MQRKDVKRAVRCGGEVERVNWKLTLRQKGLLVVAFLLGFELLLLAGLSALLHDAQMQIDRQQKNQAVISSLQRLSTLRERATNGLMVQIQFFKDPPDSPHYYETFLKYVEGVPKELETMKSLLKDDPVNKFKGEELDRICRLGIEAIKEERRLYSYKQSLQEKAVIARLCNVMFHAARLSESLLDYYTKIEQEVSPMEEKARANVENFLWAMIAVNIVIAIAVGQFFVRRITSRLSIVTENSLKLADGRPLSEPMSGYDEIVQLDNVFHRMAEKLAESARKERAIIEHAVDVICSVDANLNFLAVNPASETVLGHKPDELIGTSCMDLVVPDEIEKVGARFKSIIKDQEVADFETQLKQKSGNVIDVLWSSQWSPEENALFCVVHNISGSKEIERMKQEFVSMVSHDLRTPLSAIQGSIELFKEGMYDSNEESGKSALQKMYLSTNRLLALVNDLLDIEKLEAGKLIKDLRRTDVRDVVRKSIGSVAGFAEVHEVEVISEAGEAIIMADEDRLVQAVVNLLSNAIKFSPTGSRVIVETEVVHGDAESEQNETRNELLELRVVDEGRGIAEDKAKKLFQRYSQAEKSDGKRGVGTGLGLAISKAIIEAHNGTIGVRSKVDEGSTFWFRIPVALSSNCH